MLYNTLNKVEGQALPQIQKLMAKPIKLLDWSSCTCRFHQFLCVDVTPHVPYMSTSPSYTQYQRKPAQTTAAGHYDLYFTRLLNTNRNTVPHVWLLLAAHTPFLTVCYALPFLCFSSLEHNL